MDLNTTTTDKPVRPLSRTQDYVWFALMAMTLGSALVAESAEPSLLITLIIAITIGLKGLLVVDRFMELRNAHPKIRLAMRLYFWLLPVVIVVVWLFPDFIAEATSLRKS